MQLEIHTLTFAVPAVDPIRPEPGEYDSDQAQKHDRQELTRADVPVRMAPLRVGAIVMFHDVIAARFEVRSA